jgi:inositol polyphosphate 5-phosphatase INPP5B/F
VDVTLSVEVRSREAAVLNLQDAQLDSLLILHTSLGKDHFIAINGLWGKKLIDPCVARASLIARVERTCFATSLQRLVRIPDPVQSLKILQLAPEDQAATAPKELMRLVSWLMNYAADAVRSVHSQCSSV